MSELPNLLVDGLLREYLREVDGVRVAFMQDAQFHADVDLARRWLTWMDAAMQAERLGHAARGRVLRTAIRYALDPETAVMRVAAQREAVRRQERPPS